MVVVMYTDNVYDLDMDIYSPCALGATINDNTINQLKCSVIAGAANNQLMDEKYMVKYYFKRDCLCSRLLN